MTTNWYNESIKQEFINSYQGIVGEFTFNTIFSKTKELEQALNKDCSLFVLPEILDLARSFKSGDIASIRFKISLLKSYTQFCISKGLSKTGLNHYIEVTTAMYNEVVDKKKMAETYISREEVEDIISIFDNPRDKYIILAPFEGIYGEDLCELLKLRKKDLLGNGRVRLYTDREIVVSNMLYNIMEDAADTYVAEYNGKKRPLINTDLVFKPLDTKGSLDVIGEIQIKKKFSRLKRHLDRKTFGIRMLYTSGFLSEVDKAVQKAGSIEAAKEQINEIQIKYQSRYPINSIKKMYNEMKLVQEI